MNVKNSEPCIYIDLFTGKMVNISKNYSLTYFDEVNKYWVDFRKFTQINSAIDSYIDIKDRFPLTTKFKIVFNNYIINYYDIEHVISYDVISLPYDNKVAESFCYRKLF